MYRFSLITIGSPFANTLFIIKTAIPKQLINNKSKLINSNQFKGEHLCLPMYDTLQVNEQHYIVNSINKFIKDL